MKYFFSLLTLFYILNIVQAQDSSSVWKKYLTKSGIVNYEITTHELRNGKAIKKANEKINVKMSFDNYGAISLIEWQVPGQLMRKVFKDDSLQYDFNNDSLINVSSRIYDFDFEKIIMNSAYHCIKCITETAKPINERYLEFDCTKNFMFYSKDIANRGSMTNYLGVPLKMRFARDQKVVVTIIAKSFSLLKKEDSIEEIQKLKTITSARN